jgi:cysteine desulfurase
MKQFIYADNAATTKIDHAVFEAMIPWLTEEYGNASQPYAFARKPKKALQEARATIAQCINALPEEIFFTSGGTESDNWAIKGSAFPDLEKRATITSAIEHHAILNACAAIERLGYPVAYVYPQKDGTITPESLNTVITDQTRLVSIMFSNNEIGTVNPVKDLVKVAHEHGAIFHTDAVQALGHTEIDVQELGIDMLSASAHKFNGPKGIGFLYIKKGTPIVRFNDGGSQEFGMRSGTENIAAIVGMAAALKANIEQIEKNTKFILSLESLLINELNTGNLDYIRNGSKNHIPGNLSLSFKGCDGEAILHRMDLKGISISTGSACDSVNTQISHVITAIGVPDEYAQGTVRISLGKYNTEEDVLAIAQTLSEIVK